MSLNIYNELKQAHTSLSGSVIKTNKVKQLKVKQTSISFKIFIQIKQPLANKINQALQHFD